MTYRGRVQNGVVVLEDPSSLPEGTEVTVRPVKARRTPAKTPEPPLTVGKGLANLAGKAADLPADAADNFDHYLYGHRKR